MHELAAPLRLPRDSSFDVSQGQSGFAHVMIGIPGTNWQILLRDTYSILFRIPIK